MKVTEPSRFRPYGKNSDPHSVPARADSVEYGAGGIGQEEEKERKTSISDRLQKRPTVLLFKDRRGPRGP